MLARLIKFVILTRFSKPLLGLIAFFIVYGTVVRGVSGTASRTSGAFDYYAVGVSTFFITTSLLLGGLFVLKSDRDYLLTLPLSRRDMSIALFIAQFVGSGITIVFLYSFYLPGIASLLTTIVLVADLVLLSCLVTSLSVVSNLLGSWKRLGLAAILAAWCASSLLGFPFTPVSAFNGQIICGSAALLLLTGIMMPVALRELAYLELGSLRTMQRTTSSEYKQNMSFNGKSPVGAVYFYHLSFMELVGRINIGGSTSYRTARIKTRTVLIITIVAGVAYFFFASDSLFGGLQLGETGLRPLVFVLPIFLAVATLLLMAQGTFANERGWLAFTAMDPATYLRHLVLSRFVSILAIVSPFAIADILLGFLGQPAGFNSALVLLITTPAASILATYIVARLGAVQQVKEEGMMPGQFDLRQVMVVLPIYMVIGLIIASELSPIAALAIASAVGILSIILLSQANVWRGIAYRLTERGFI